MKEPTSILEAQVGTLLEYLRRYEVQQIERLLERSYGVAAELIRNAHRRAREHMHRRIEQERRRLREAEETANARLAAKKRVAGYAALNASIQAAWERLPKALQGRWARPEDRRAWCDAILRQACRSLQGPQILVEYPAGWAKAEQRRFLAEIRRHFGRQAETRADAALEAGLRVCAGDACLDGSIAGLLAQRSRIEAQFVAELLQSRSARATETGMPAARHD
jgi:hypothetical protein